MQHQAYNLPKGWRLVRLADVCTINPRRPRLRLCGNQLITFVPMRAIDEKTGRITSPEERPFEQVRSGYTYFQEGDILFARITPCMENGKIAVARGSLNEFGFGTTEFHVLRPDKDVLAEWLWAFVRRCEFRREAKAAMQGAVGHQRVPAHFLEEHLLPLPPLDEQQRIVARIEELMERIREARQLREKARADAERLWQSVLADTFPRPGEELPKGWRWVKLGEVCELRNGKAYRKTDWSKSGYPIIRIQNLNNPAAAFNFWPGTLDSQVAVYPGDILISWSGTPGTSFDAHIWEKPVVGVLNQHIWKVEFAKAVYLPKFFAECVNRMVDVMIRVAHGGVGLGHITKKEIKRLALPLPPLDEQKRIVARLEAVQARIRELTAAQEETAEKLQALERSILDRAFRAEL